MLNLRAGVVMQKIEAQAVLLDTDAGIYFSLNHSGVAMLEALLTGLDEQQTCARISALYEITLERVQEDLRHLLAALRERQLIS